MKSLSTILIVTLSLSGCAVSETARDERWYAMETEQGISDECKRRGQILYCEGRYSQKKCGCASVRDVFRVGNGQMPNY